VEEERRIGIGRRALDDPVDATRRTRLANERTYLAWWRTGLTALAVGLGAGKLVPGLSNSEHTWGYQVVGAGFALLGLVCIGYAMRRQDEVEKALSSGRFAPPDRRVTMALTAIGVLLALATIVLIASGS
jgi:putative membrane protein